MTRSTWTAGDACVAAVLIVFGNLADIAVGPDVLAISWPGGVKAAGTLLITVAAAGWCAVTLREAGLRRSGALRSAAIGGGIALGLAAMSLVALRFGPFVGGRVTYAPLQGEAVPPLLFHALVALPLQTAVPEELAFRGVLLGLLFRRLSPWRASLAMSGAFVAWHVVVQAQTLAQTNLRGLLLIPPQSPPDLRSSSGACSSGSSGCAPATWPAPSPRTGGSTPVWCSASTRSRTHDDSGTQPGLTPATRGHRLVTSKYP